MDGWRSNGEALDDDEINYISHLCGAWCGHDVAGLVPSGSFPPIYQYFDHCGTGSVSDMALLLQY